MLDPVGAAPVPIVRPQITVIEGGSSDVRGEKIRQRAYLERMCQHHDTLAVYHDEQCSRHEERRDYYAGQLRRRSQQRINNEKGDTNA